MVINGVKFKKDAAVVHAVDADLPEVAKIQTIYVVNGSTVIFAVECFSTTYYPHYRVYALQHSSHETLLKHDQLSLHLPIHPRKTRVLPNETVVIMPHSISDYS